MKIHTANLAQNSHIDTPLKNILNEKRNQYAHLKGVSVFGNLVILVLSVGGIFYVLRTSFKNPATARSMIGTLVIVLLVMVVLFADAVFGITSILLSHK